MFRVAARKRRVLFQDVFGSTSSSPLVITRDFLRPDVTIHFGFPHERGHVWSCTRCERREKRISIHRSQSTCTNWSGPDLDSLEFCMWFAWDYDIRIAKGELYKVHTCTYVW